MVPQRGLQKKKREKRVKIIQRGAGSKKKWGGKVQ